MTRSLNCWVALLAALGTGLAGCTAGPFAARSGTDELTLASDAAPHAKSVKLIDRDVEAPEIFQVTGEALWDGRPSLGGVWVASADAVNPERVILRNTSTGKFVIGALFRRERDSSIPDLQISSDAAEALGLLAGQPANLQVTALRRDEVAATPPDATKPILDAAEAIEATPPDSLTIAGVVIDGPGELPGTGTVVNAGSQPALQTAGVPSQMRAANPVSSGGSQIQIGIFSVEANAKRAVDTLTRSGVTADLRREVIQGKTFWSVTARGDAVTLGMVKTAGFADAYVLKR